MLTLAAVKGGGDRRERIEVERDGDRGDERPRQVDADAGQVRGRDRVIARAGTGRRFISLRRVHPERA